MSEEVIIKIIEFVGLFVIFGGFYMCIKLLLPSLIEDSKRRNKALETKNEILEEINKSLKELNNVK